MKYFRCQHPAIPDNLTCRGGKLRCRICVKAQDARNNHRRRLENARSSSCLLAQAW